MMDNVRRRSDVVIVNMDETEKSNNDNVEYQGLEAPINTSCPEISTVSWIIPRPTLMRTHTDNGHEITAEHIFKQGNTFPTNLLLAVPAASTTNNRNQSISSTTSCSSNSSSKSAKSNTLLLTAANLAAFKFDKVKPHHDYVPPHTKNYDTESLASSTHFTLVNGMERKLPKHMKPVECCCEKHQLSILITTMTIFLAVTIFLCIYFFQSRVRDQVHWS